MNFETYQTRKQREAKCKEMINDFLLQGGAIRVIDTESVKQLEFPVRPKGQQMPGQPLGCLRVPSYVGN